MSRPQSFAFLGTRGIPASYGGFETCVEEVGRRLVERGHQVRVYSKRSASTIQELHGMEVVQVPAISKRTTETLSRATLSALHVLGNRVDYVFAFNIAIVDLACVLGWAGIRIALHLDGLESQREKWGLWGQRYYSRCEKRAAKSNLPLIADAHGIADYYYERFGRATQYIPYGTPTISASPHLLEAVALRPRQYHLIVARLEPENHVLQAAHAYLRSHARFPLVIVGDVPYDSPYRREFICTVSGKARIRWLGSLWDQPLLDELYRSSVSYIHGHSVGGTNPSLLRAHGAGVPVLAYDCRFNREVSGSYAHYWKGAYLAQLIEQVESSPEEASNWAREGQLRIRTLYNWDAVTDSYERLAAVQ